MGCRLPELHPGLPFDAFDRADRHVLSRVWNGHSIRQMRMPKLMMAPLVSHETPSGGLKLADDRPAVVDEGAP
jgi:hypothetical protein